MFQIISNLYRLSIKNKIFRHKKLINRHFKPNRFRKPVRFDDGFENNDCPVRDRILVERNADRCMSRELPTVFHVIGSASRENLSDNYFSTDILSLTGHFHF
ncbi:MAG: hypothetical protein LBS69_06725 [Prevotellaceae bacterium]|nr:hypothetical protein [Prevotellaceae bacterium]